VAPRELLIPWHFLTGGKNYRPVRAITPPRCRYPNLGHWLAKKGKQKQENRRSKATHS
jgi:hypothetical protein